MATTAAGWPYVEPADHPLEYPTVSQQLATKLESDASMTLGLIVPLAPWADALTGMYATRVGKLVVVEAALKHTSGVTLGAGVFVNVGTLPVGFRPTMNRGQGGVSIYTGSAFAQNGTVEFQSNGNIRIAAIVATTLAANTGTVSFLASFRGA